MRTQSAKKNEVSRNWYVVDATDQPLGRLASRVARVLRGKHRPDYTPHVDAGDFVVVINAEKILLTGDKKRTKIFYRHSGHPGGIWKEPYGQLPSASRPSPSRRPSAACSRRTGWGGP
jgi:large subunit ribosomal protein L13